MRVKSIWNKILPVALCLLLVMPGHAHAHAMFLTLEEPGVLRVEYDGGGFSPRTIVTVFDEKNNELEKGPVDAEGKFYFDENFHVYSAIAEDGMGHRAECKKGVEEKKLPKLPVVIGVFAVVAAVFVVFNKRAAKKES